MSTATDTDVSVMVGPIEAPPCESSEHDSTPNHGGAATHYARVCCPFCGGGGIRAYCGPFVAFLSQTNYIRHEICGALSKATEAITILGPITEYLQ
jgi:hypothetical protein